MARNCTVCSRPHREAIDVALVGSDSFKPIADRFGLTKQSLMRHKANHIPLTLAKAQEAAEVLQADNLLESIRRLHARTLAILTAAELNGDRLSALRAIKEARANLELLGKLDGQLREHEPGSVTINVVYQDRPLIIPGDTQARGIAGGAVEPISEIAGREKGEALPFAVSKS